MTTEVSGGLVWAGGESAADADEVSIMSSESSPSETGRCLRRRLRFVVSPANKQQTTVAYTIQHSTWHTRHNTSRGERRPLLARRLGMSS